MIKLKQKHIDNMLRQTFREEAEKIVLPSSDKLWAELQSRLEPHKIPELEEQAGNLLAKGIKPEKFDSFTFWKKHRYLAGIAAACFLMIIVTVSTLPEILAFIQGNKVSMEMGIRSDSAGQADLMESENLTLEESFTLQGIDEGPAPNDGKMELSIKGPVDDAPMQIESFPLGRGDEKFDAAEEKIETLFFTDEENFVSSLRKSKFYYTEEIWHIKVAPKDFSFKSAVITNKENSLLNVFQEYEGPEGKIMTLIQEFFDDGKVLDSSIHTADSLSHPIQVGSYSGHLLRQPYGFHMVIWMQDNSRVTLSGQLSEEELFEVLNSLEK
jgi:hypothetical protein